MANELQRAIWASLKKAAPKSPEDFMVYLWSVVPELDVTTHETSVKRILNEFEELASSALDPIKKLLAEKMRMKKLLAEKEKELEATHSRLKALEDDIRSTQTSIDSAGVRIAGTIYMKTRNYYFCKDECWEEWLNEY